MAYRRASGPKIEFNQLNTALKTLGLSSEMIEMIYQRFAAILHLGNVTFDADSDGFAHISENSNSRKSLDVAAQLLDVEVDNLERALLDRDIRVKSSNIV